MSSTTRKLGLVTGLIIISLAGLLLVQGLLLRNAWDQKDQAFRRNVMMVLGSVAQKLEAREAAKSALASMPGLPLQHRIGIGAIVQTGREAEDSAVSQSLICDTAIPVRVANGIIHYTVPTKQHVTIQILDTARGVNRTLVDTEKLPGDYEYNLGDSESANRSLLFNFSSTHRRSTGPDSMFFRFSSDSTSMIFQVSNGQQIRSSYQSVAAGNKQRMVSQMIDQLFYVEMEPISNRLNDTLLDSVISSTLSEAGLKVKYAYGVIDPRDSLTLVRPAALAPQIRNTEFRTRLFPHDVFAPASELAMFFPERTTYLWVQIGPLLGLTSLFMIIIASCFAYSIRTIVKQRQFAHRTADFINNMTHEFKTPISTISLAAEALAKPGVAAHGETIQRFGKMIQEENKRMSGQVEKILQMATLEEGDYELNVTLVDMHELIQKATNAVTLRVQGRGGSLTTDLLAERAYISGDPVHLANIMHNLLDNALKYTTDTPVIRVATSNENTDLVVAIEDNGIGIAEKDIKLVFEKYYRVPTGNIHNVKGFGIGLSYVKMMVEAHQGRIDLTSEPGKGTRIEIAFPLASAGSE